MGRFVLGALILAGLLAPLCWLLPWRYFAERQTLREILGRHPKVRLEKLETLSGALATAELRRIDPAATERPSSGLVLLVSVRQADGPELLALRREVRNNRSLEKTFGSPSCEISNPGWQVHDPDAPEDPPMTISFLFFSRKR